MKINKTKNKRRGLETVEAALLLPIVMMVTIGALKYGWIFLKYQQITNAARQAARIAICDGASSASVGTEITNRMSEAGITGYSYTLTTTTVVGDPVIVHITVPATPATHVDILPTGSWIPTPANLSATITMCKEGPGQN